MQASTRLNPYVLDRYDGVSLHPYEVLFVKVKGFMLDAQWPTALTAVKYDTWSNAWVRACCVVHRRLHKLAQVAQQPNSNDYTRHMALYTEPRAWLMQHRNRSCFDAVFYQQRSADLAGMEQQDLWPHFVQHGQFEGRPWRSDERGPPQTLVFKAHHMHALVFAARLVCVHKSTQAALQ